MDPGGWKAIFGCGSNILVNLLSLIALLRFVVQMPDALVTPQPASALTAHAAASL
ncbi:MAG: hypothetical protein AB7N91_02260 [Candidatus Tectimicrobiota bacterium]